MFNSSTLEGKFVGAAIDLMPTMKYIASVGHYQLNGTVYKYKQLCSGFLATVRHIFSSRRCKTELDPYKSNNYPGIRAFVGMYSLK